MRRKTFLDNFERINGDQWELVEYRDKKTVMVRCRDCGAVTVYHSTTLDHAHIPCKECETVRKEKRNEEKEREKAELDRIKLQLKEIKEQRRKLESFKRRFERDIERVRNRDANRERNRQKQRQRDKLNELKREKRIKNNGRIDKDICLRSLYERDKGICHICGDHCDYSDHKVTDEGYFIAGLRYPSIDHVIPLSKGGTHTWDNVKLACFGCNSLKGNNDGISPMGIATAQK